MTQIATQIGKLGRNALVYGAGQMATKVIGIMTLPLVTGYLGREEFGLLALIMLTGLFARMIFGLGLSPAMGVMYFDTDAPEHRERVTTAAITLAATMAAALLVSSVILAGPLLNFLDQGARIPKTVIAIQAATVAIGLLADPLLMRLQLDSRPVPFVCAGIVAAVLGAALGLSLLIFAGWGVVGLLLGHLLGATISLIVSAAICAPEQWKRPNSTMLWKFVRMGSPLVGSAFVVFILFNAGVPLLTYTTGLAEAGIFAAASQVGMAMGLLVGAVGAAWQPFFLSYKTKVDDASQIFPIVATTYAMVFGFGTLCAYVFAKPVAALLLAPGFADAFKAIGPIAGAQVLLGLWSLVLPGLYFSERIHLLLVSQTIAALVALASQLWLGPLFGAEGAAYGILLGSAAMVCVQLVLNAIQDYEVRLMQPVRIAILIISTAALCLIQRLFIDQLPDLTWSLISSFILLCAFILVCALMLSPAERSQLMTLITKPAGAP